MASIPSRRIRPRKLSQWRRSVWLSIFLTSAVPILRGQSAPPAWQQRALAHLCTKYLSASSPTFAVSGVKGCSLQNLLPVVGKRLAQSGSRGVPAEDLAMVALLEARQEGSPTPSTQTVAPSTPQSLGGTKSRPQTVTRRVASTGRANGDVEKGEEGIRQAIERLSTLPVSTRLVTNGDVTAAMQGANVPNAPNLATTVGRARMNFLLRAVPGATGGRLGPGYFFLRILAAGGAADSSAVGGPKSFSAFDTIATYRSAFNEGTSMGNIYLGKAFYRQRLNFRNDYLVLDGGIVNLGDYFDTNVYANNEARQFLNYSFVDSPAFKPSYVIAPGVVGEYHHKTNLGWLPEVVFRGAYSVTTTNRALTSPLWLGEVGLATTLRGYTGHWRFGGSIGNRAGVGGLRGVHFSMDQAFPHGWGMFARYAVSNSGPGSRAYGAARMSYGFGVQRRFVDREDRVSAWSLGFSQAFGIPTGKPQVSERVLETYYRWQWTKNMSFSPDLQLVLGSGGRVKDGTQLVVGSRVNFVF